ncbi:hypothetical protein LVB87_11670 [Lysobacter sp. KIS68-7]|uniref:right-handed parallel beta-helix repeat-containing protein n=1 Tax=Lysobacter sp. KIS68-7 TaxID=2904252 RepID=UPI001E5B9870|nr:right-handed parallel beta-helix repeat-containing protein [Lysobacter sp. KIS68-7]UHQ18839.1 hypothetical protein LVB87_11670 [Lysobacter sp. KIS68-7]
MKRLYQLAALVLLASPAAAFAQSCTTITAVPAVISAPGKYCLASDFTINSTTAKAININASDVTLDCDGHTLKNAATANNGTSAGIYIGNRNNIVVKNCRVIGGFQNGIDLFQTNTQPNKNYYVQIRDNYVAGPFWHGIRAYGSALEVTGNKVYDVGGQVNTYAIGIRLGGSTSGFRQHIVRDNLVVGTNSPASAAYGIFSDGSLSSVYAQNVVAGTSASAGKVTYGMYITGTFNRVSDNHVTGVGSPDDTAIFTTDGSTSCFDNYLRSATRTLNCDATMGNF